MFCGSQSAVDGLAGMQAGKLVVKRLGNDSPLLKCTIDPSRRTDAHKQAVTAVCAFGLTVATGSEDGSIHLWNFSRTTLSFLFALQRHSARVTGLILLSSTLLWSSSADGSILIWDLTKRACVQCLTTRASGAAVASRHSVLNQAVSGAITGMQSLTCSRGTIVFSSCSDGTVEAWAANTGECLQSIPMGESVMSLAILPHNSSHLLLIGLESGKICWSLPFARISAHLL